jgi:hypothetical protein
MKYLLWVFSTCPAKERIPMEKLTVLPDAPITDAGAVAKKFLEMGITSFQAACDHVQQLPYGYNSDRDDLMILFKENMGTCTTKHAVVATLAIELDLSVSKQIGIYAMTEAIVDNAGEILNRFSLPYIPMVHCFLVHEAHRVDLTEGNRNGKKCAIDNFLFTAPVAPDISAKQEYLLYRQILEQEILKRDEMSGVQMKQVLQAREQGLELLKQNIF